MFKRILVSIVWLLACSWMQTLCHACGMQVLYHISSMQILCHVMASLQHLCQIRIGTGVAIAWNIPKVIGTNLANTETIPVKTGIDLAGMQTSFQSVCGMQRICQTYLTTGYLLTAQSLAYCSVTYLSVSN